MKEAFRGYVQRLKDNCSVKTYALWWLFRGAMIVLIINSILRPDPEKQIATVQLIMFTSCMFIWEICMAMPPKNVFRYVRPFLQTIITLCVFLIVVGGHVFNFYYTTRMWDSFLHFGSGIIAVYFGYEITCALFIMEKRTASLTMTIIASVGFCFMCTTFWEIFEFCCDQFVGMVGENASDVQHWSYEIVESLNSPKLQTLFEPYDVGRWPIMDTMGDIVLNTAGAVLGALAVKIYPYRHKGKHKYNFEF
ncbi:MAG: hypothetical protein IKJ27_11080 [Clostridia bacterium]|nr:hypothetical protein [Clostridia bacterium]